MDGIRHPVGNQPANIYWRRRVFVVVAIVVLALFVWWVISMLSGGSSDPKTTPEVTTSPTVTTSAAPDLDRACTGNDYTVVVDVPAEVSGSKKVSFTATVTSTADTPCIIDPTVDSKLTVRSGSDAWFDSSDCPADFALFDSEKFMLDSGKTRDLKTSWNYGRDEKGCVADLQTAKSGTYKATVTVAGVKADESTFAVK
ncbi:hypothetical protein [Demequina sp.]|uniref:hypothetical protein n=1 Tax=Demequina sp. TaxID=2050685 RepID=UPI003D0A2182